MKYIGVPNICRCIFEGDIPSEIEYVYGGASNCQDVEVSLYHLVCVQCGLYAGALLLSLIGGLLVVHVLRNYGHTVAYTTQVS